MADMNVAASGAQHCRAMDVADGYLPACRVHTKTAPDISNADIAARRLEPRDNPLAGGRTSFGVPDIPHMNPSTPGRKRNPAVDSFGCEIAGPHGYVQVVPARHVNFVSQAATILRKTIGSDQRNALGRFASYQGTRR
jgi:hypothetical protein